MLRHQKAHFLSESGVHWIFWFLPTLKTRETPVCRAHTRHLTYTRTQSRLCSCFQNSRPFMEHTSDDGPPDLLAASRAVSALAPLEDAPRHVLATDPLPASSSPPDSASHAGSAGSKDKLLSGILGPEQTSRLDVEMSAVIDRAVFERSQTRPVFASTTTLTSSPRQRAAWLTPSLLARWCLGAEERTIQQTPVCIFRLRTRTTSSAQGVAAACSRSGLHTSLATR